MVVKPSETSNKRKRPAMVHSFPLDQVGSLECDVSTLNELGESNHSAWLNWRRSDGGGEKARVQSFSLGRCKIVRVQHDANPARGPAKTNISFVLEKDGLDGAEKLNRLVEAFRSLPQFKMTSSANLPFREDPLSGDWYLNTSLYESARTPCVTKNARGRTVDLLSLAVGQYVDIQKLFVNCATVYEGDDGTMHFSVKANPKLLIAEEAPKAKEALAESKRAQGKTTTVNVSDMLK